MSDDELKELNVLVDKRNGHDFQLTATELKRHDELINMWWETERAKTQTLTPQWG